ncbi:MAG: hypothetical protein ACLTSX_02770 [Collinsella sp.]
MTERTDTRRARRASGHRPPHPVRCCIGVCSSRRAGSFTGCLESSS